MAILWDSWEAGHGGHTCSPSSHKLKVISSLEGVQCWPGSQQETHVNNRIQIKILKTLRIPPKLKNKNRLQNGGKSPSAKHLAENQGWENRKVFWRSGVRRMKTESSVRRMKKSCGLMKRFPCIRHEESTQLRELCSCAQEGGGTAPPVRNTGL